MKLWIIDTLCLLGIFIAVAVMILGCSAWGINQQLKVHPEYAEAR